MSELPTIQILRPYDNWEAVYLNEKLLVEAHSVSAQDLADALMREGVIRSVDTFDAYEDADEDDFEYNDDGDISYAGALIWKNGDGCPQEWPFELEG